MLSEHGFSVAMEMAKSAHEMERQGLEWSPLKNALNYLIECVCSLKR